MLASRQGIICAQALLTAAAVIAIVACKKDKASDTSSCQPAANGAVIMVYRLNSDGSAAPGACATTNTDPSDGVVSAQSNDTASSQAGGGTVVAIDTKQVTPTTTTKPTAKPAAFAYSSPGLTNDATPTITWGASAQAASYSLAFAQNSDCTGSVATVDAVTSLAAEPAAPLTDGTYYVCVTAHNELGDTPATSNGAAIAIDATKPSALSGFSATTGATIGSISILTYLANDRADYATYTIRSKAGATPPADCNDGQVVVTTSNFLNSGLNSIINTTPGTQWSFRACVYDAAGNVTDDAVDTATAQAHHHIFATHTAYNGNLAAAYGIRQPFSTGLAGADSRCQDAATGIGSKYNYQGTWKAVLSSSTVNAKDRLSIVAPIDNVTSSGATHLVANDANQLWGATLSNNIYYDEFGNMGGAGAWTGSNANGTADTSNTCTNWTVSASGGHGAVGSVGAVSSQWLAFGPFTCDATYSLYCIDQQ